MPRPRRTKVASANPATTRVTVKASANKSSNVPRKIEDLVEAEVQEDQAHGKAAKQKGVQRAQESETGGQSTSRPGRVGNISETAPTTKSRQPKRAQQNKSALSALGRRRQTNESSPNASSVALVETGSPRVGSAKSAARRSVIMETSTVTMSRPQTPAAGDDTLDTDLYGLSPSGEISQTRIEARFQARRASMQQDQPVPASTLQVRATPHVDGSTTALQNFKRRPRQPSMLRMVQQTSEMGDADYQNLDDFDLPPDDESTPLHLTKFNLREPLSGTNKTVPAPNTSSSRKRKRSAEVQVPNSPHSLHSSPPPGLARSRSPSSSISSELPDRAIHSTEQEEEPRILSDIMADPLSSSMMGDETQSAERSNRSNKHPRIAALESDVRRQATVGRKTRKVVGQAAVTTITLESLLPRPRRGTRVAAARRIDVLDIPDSDPPEQHGSMTTSDEDEFSPKSRRRAAATKSSKTSTKPTEKTTAGRAHRQIDSPKSARKQQRGKELTTTQKVTRTYARKSMDTGKENNDTTMFSDDDNSDSDRSGSEIEVGRLRRAATRPLVEIRVSKEMEAAKKKFAEVDEWAMEFESAAEGPTSSDWR